MPGTVTRRFRIHNAQQFHEAFSEAAPTQMYLFIGRVDSFPDDNNPPTPPDSIQETEFNQWRNMLAAKRVQTSDISFSLARYNWSTGKVYRQFDPTSNTLYDTPAGSNTMYVMTSDFNVYKCLFNNKGGSSSVEPSGTSTATLSTADGYKWKFMYSVSAADALKFVTTNFIPVQTLSANDGSAQFSVQSAASNGNIEVIDVIGGGSNFKSHSGTVASPAAGSIVISASGANTSDDVYNGSVLHIASGLGAGQVREIVNYVGSSRTISVNNNFTTTPNTSSTYSIGPKVAITGDGSGAVAIANTTGTNEAGAVNIITMISTGSNYSNAAVTISANVGSGATAQAFIAPPGGHGSDAVSELGGHNVMLNVQLSGSESNTFPTANDFRMVGLLKDPILEANGSLATGSSFDLTERITCTSISGAARYNPDETITGGTTGATAKFVSFANTNTANTAGELRLTSRSGIGFQAAETITGGGSGITATVASITKPDLRNNFGDVLYVENRAPVSRSGDQIEDIKLVVKF